MLRNPMRIFRDGSTLRDPLDGYVPDDKLFHLPDHSNRDKRDRGLDHLDSVEGT